MGALVPSCDKSGMGWPHPRRKVQGMACKEATFELEGLLTRKN